MSELQGEANITKNQVNAGSESSAVQPHKSWRDKAKEFGKAGFHLAAESAKQAFSNEAAHLTQGVVGRVPVGNTIRQVLNGDGNPVGNVVQSTVTNEVGRIPGANTARQVLGRDGNPAGNGVPNAVTNEVSRVPGGNTVHQVMNGEANRLSNGVESSITNQVGRLPVVGRFAAAGIHELRRSAARHANDGVNGVARDASRQPNNNNTQDGTSAGRSVTDQQTAGKQRQTVETTVSGSMQKPAVSDAMRNPSSATDTSGSMQVETSSLYKKVEVKPQAPQSSGDATQAAANKTENHGIKFHDYKLDAVSQAGADRKNATQSTGKVEASPPVKFHDYSQTKTNGASSQTGSHLEFIKGQGLYDVYPDGTKKVHSVTDK